MAAQSCTLQLVSASVPLSARCRMPYYQLPCSGGVRDIYVKYVYFCAFLLIIRKIRVIYIIVRKTTYMRFREADRMLKDDGWYVSDISGSHYQYKHPAKPGKVSVPNHPSDIPKSIVKSIRRQAGLK